MKYEIQSLLNGCNVGKYKTVIEVDGNSNVNYIVYENENDSCRVATIYPNNLKIVYDIDAMSDLFASSGEIISDLLGELTEANIKIEKLEKTMSVIKFLLNTLGKGDDLLPLREIVDGYGV